MKVRLSFTREQDVFRDVAAGGVLRMPTQNDDPAQNASVQNHWCQAVDLATANPPDYSLARTGFAQVRLDTHVNLQTALEEARVAGSLDGAVARRIRRQVQGATFRLPEGKRLKVLFVAAEGMIMRSSGPNGLDVSPDQILTERNGHKAADRVHGDQDVFGTPLRQMLKGFAPRIFRHQTYKRCNRFSPVNLLNLWIPLQQLTQPLALADRRTINSGRQQVRYALPTQAFLDRTSEAQLNDIWLFLHDQEQRWFCDTDMDSRKAYVFDTLGEPHGAATLTGEDVAEQYYLQVGDMISAVLAQDVGLLERASKRQVLDMPAQAPSSLRAVTSRLQELVEEARNTESCALFKSDWAHRAESVRSLLVRTSIEMRLVALVF